MGLESAPSTSRGYKYTLFVPPRDAHEALWGGEVSGIEGALTTFGADEVSPLTNLLIRSAGDTAHDDSELMR